LANSMEIRPVFTKGSRQIGISPDGQVATKIEAGGDLWNDANKGVQCTDWVMCVGIHYAELEILQSGSEREAKIFFGVGRPRRSDDEGLEAGLTSNEWGVLGNNGQFCHPAVGSYTPTTEDPAKHGVDWVGQESFGLGDKIGLLFDSDKGSLTVYKNERKLGVASVSIPRRTDLCFTVGLRNKGDQVRIQRAEEPPHQPQPQPRALIAMATQKCQWMWEDAGDYLGTLGKAMARINDLRWTRGTPLEAADKLQQETAENPQKHAGRRVLVRWERVDDKVQQERVLEGVEAALAFLRGELATSSTPSEPDDGSQADATTHIEPEPEMELQPEPEPE
jgi:hypothetical protein